MKLYRNDPRMVHYENCSTGSGLRKKWPTELQIRKTFKQHLHLNHWIDSDETVHDVGQSFTCTGLPNKVVAGTKKEKKTFKQHLLLNRLVDFSGNVQVVQKMLKSFWSAD